MSGKTVPGKTVPGKTVPGKTIRSVRLVVAVVMLLVVPVGIPAADAAMPTAAVAMGDSFVSGEGASGYQAVVDVNGVAQGYQDFSAPNNNAYFCHRSGNSEIEVAKDLDGIEARFNIACSGAVPYDIGSASNTRPYGRMVAPQIEQLRAIGETHDIDLVLIGLGANSLGFGDVTQKCIFNFLIDAYTGWWEPWVNPFFPNATTQGTCGAGDFPNDADVARAQAEVEAAVRLILSTLEEIDADGQHRVILQDYTNPLPPEFHTDFHSQNGRRDSRDKFRALARERYAAGCPVHRGALPHAHGMSEDLGAIVAGVQDQMMREFPSADIVYLNVQKAFDGARLCETSSSPDHALHTPTRVVTSRTGHVQHTLDGDKLDLFKLLENCFNHFQRCQETWHPNAAGHAVLGKCLAGAWRSATPIMDCRRTSRGQISTTSRQSSVDVDVSASVIETLDRSGRPALQVSASYASWLLDAPGTSVTSVRVTARDSARATALPTRSTTSGVYTYRLRCQPTTINLTVTVSLTLNDGRTVSGHDTYRRSVSNCGGGGGGDQAPIA